MTKKIYAVRYTPPGSIPQFAVNANHWNNPRLGMGTLQGARNVVASHIGTISTGFLFKTHTDFTHDVNRYSIMAISPDGSVEDIQPLNGKRMAAWRQHEATL